MPLDTSYTVAAPASPREGLPRRVIQVAFSAVTRVAPGLAPRLQRSLIRAGYALVSLVMNRGADVTFLNFGYAALDPAAAGGIEPKPEDRPNTYAIQLYHRVTGARDLRGKDVLEVGSGRGGGASFMMRYLGPRSVTGVDFAASAVRFCRRRHRLEGLTFVEGNAENLPFPPQAFDVVVNVESSHCYPSMEGFLREVTRVLRPGGELLFADLRPRAKVAELREQLARSFTVVEEESITANVFRALELYSDDRAKLIERAPGLLRTPLRNFAALKGTPTFAAFASGEMEYVRFVARRPLILQP